MVGQAAQESDVTGGPGVLETAHAQWLLATRVSTAPGSTVSRCDGPPGRHDGEGPRGGDAQGVHRLADDVLAQHRPDDCEAVATAGEGCAAGALQVDVAEAAADVGNLTEQQRTTVAQTAGEYQPNWWPAYACATGVAPSGSSLPISRGSPSGLRRNVRVKAQVGGQGFVQHQQPRIRNLLRLPGNGHLGKLRGEAAFKGDG